MLSRFSLGCLVVALATGVAACGAAPDDGFSEVGAEQAPDRESVGHVNQALESPAVMFLWNDRAAEAIGVDYIPNSRYRSNRIDDRTMGVRRTGLGQYTVTFGLPHEPLDLPVISQVVAYGSDDARCKFRKASEPVTCTEPSGGPGVCSEVYVACFNAAGASVNSRFAIQLAAWPVSGSIGSAHAGFMETADGGTTVQHTWTLSGGRFVRTSDPVAGNSADPSLPSMRRVSTGRYRFDFPNLASKTPWGLTQVTAIGPDAVHCKPSTLPWRAGVGSSTLRLEVRCFAGTTPADSALVVNYDTYLTRRGSGYQGARADATSPTATPYFPSRSYNSGSIFGSPGLNIAHRVSEGSYVMQHTSLNAEGSSAYVTAYGTSPDYCKLNGWFAWGSDTLVWSLCFDADGNPKDTRYFEMYQGGLIGPS